MSYHQVSSTDMNYIISVLKTRKFVDEPVLTETLTPIFETLRRLEKRVLTLEAVITGKSGTNSIRADDDAPSDRSLKQKHSTREERPVREERPREERSREERPREERSREERPVREERHREEKPRRTKAKDLLSTLE